MYGFTTQEYLERTAEVMPTLTDRSASQTSLLGVQ
jgi:hypothetical protein